MKKFNFKISNFYSIFNQMPDDNKNLDSFLDNSIRQSLHESVSDDFSNELMKRVEIEKEFAREDVKTYRMAKYIVGLFAFLLAAFVGLLTLIINTNQESKDVGVFNSMVDRFSTFIESLSFAASDTLGISLNFQSALMIFVAMICILLFTFADKSLFKKS